MTYGTPYAKDGGSSEMTILNASDARANLYRLIDQTNESHEPVIISGKRNNAILLSEDDWNSIQETLFLTSIPGMRESIVEGMKEPLSESSKELDW
jgi:prevent-host-death family protein